MVSSMTGFASASGEVESLSWSFEVKSVNGRGLDVRLNLPNGCEKLEQAIRALFKASFTRGNMQANLQVKDRLDAGQVSIDRRVLSTLARRARGLDRLNGRPVSSAGDLFNLRGVLNAERTAMEILPNGQIGKAILQGVKTALDELDGARRTEGMALKSVSSRILSDMIAETEKAMETADVQPGQMKAKLQERISAILSDSRISDERLEQEIAILVTKADVTEEIDRLKAHFVEAERLLASDKPVGRKLDFLSQELLREANTMGSKSASLEMTRHSLALKTLIDQFKEQAANVE